MPRVVSQFEWDQLAQQVAAFPSGASVEVLVSALPTKVHRRSLQRRLASLVEQGRLQQVGKGRACRYVATPIEPPMAIALPSSPESHGQRGLGAHSDAYSGFHPGAHTGDHSVAVHPGMFPRMHYEQVVESLRLGVAQPMPAYQTSLPTEPGAPRVAAQVWSETPTARPEPEPLALPLNTIPYSAAAYEVQALVRKPIALRARVGYQLEFLQAYQPNISSYLPLALRRDLRHMGQVRKAAHADGVSDGRSTTAPLAGTFARDILNRLLIDLSWASSRLEGNTYSWLETEKLIVVGLEASGKDVAEARMILNHKQAIEYLVLSPENAQVSADTLIAVHALLTYGLLEDPASVGRLRQSGVGIQGSCYLPLTLPHLVADVFASVVDKAARIVDPFEQAFFLLLHLPYLQAFADGNKRVSRLAANIPLIRNNLCPLSFIGVPQQDYVDGLLGVYELNRVELLQEVFVRAYERSCQQYVAVVPTMVQPDLFRLRHRKALSAVIADIVRGGLQASEANVQAHIPSSVAQADRESFVRMAVDEFKSLHAGNAVCHGLRGLEFAAWCVQQDA